MIGRPKDGRALVFRIGGRRFGIELESLRGVVEVDALCRVPGTPPAIVGVAAWRGRVLSVVDLPRALGLEPIEGPTCLARLALPLDSTALLVPRRLRVAELESETLTLVDPPALVRRLEATMERRS